MFRPELARFLADCLEIPELHCYADPLAGLTANILDPGQLFTWHFDTNDFAVTVSCKKRTKADFRVLPAIRNADDEGFDRIAAVLAGEREGVHTLDLRPGDLQIFRGATAFTRSRGCRRTADHATLRSSPTPRKPV